jgi:hypothetical protein
MTDNRLEFGDTSLYEASAGGLRTSFPAPLVENFGDCDRLRWEVDLQTEEIIVTPYRDEEGEPE